MKVKSTVDEIRVRFDNDVERFSNLETGQRATIDAPLAMELITAAAATCNPDAKAVLDIGCGAGNNTLKLLDRLQSQGRSIQEIEWSLLDLSRPMLERAEQRVRAAGATQLKIVQADLRRTNLPEGHFDVILAAAVLHHLRDDVDWETTFQKIFRLLAPGGSLWVTDFVAHEGNAIHQMMWDRYGDYLVQTGGPEYRDKVFAYVEQEDSPRPVTYQISLMQRVGFLEIEILHKNSCFAAFGGRKL